MDQTLVLRLDRQLGIIAEKEGEINGCASSHPAINQHC
jgi:hypothetical protein